VVVDHTSRAILGNELATQIHIARAGGESVLLAVAKEQLPTLAIHRGAAGLGVEP